MVYCFFRHEKNRSFSSLARESGNMFIKAETATRRRRSRCFIFVWRGEITEFPMDFLPSYKYIYGGVIQR
jgi:hypothetical protein